MSTPFDPFEESVEPVQEEIVPVSPTDSVEDETTPVFPISDTQEAQEALPTTETTESSLPPEAQGETNGGPLGCCLGTVSGLFLTVLVITLISIAVTNQRYLSPGWAMVPAALVGAIVGGWIGWRVGKMVYREYELSPERRERLARLDQQWQNKQKRTGRVRRAKIG